MDEEEALMESLVDKSSATRKTYKAQYKKLHKLIGNDIASVSQKNAIQAIKEEVNNPNSQQALINIAIIVRKIRNLPVHQLEAERESNKEMINIQIKENNKNLDLPSLVQLEDYTQSLYQQNNWTDYIINFLLLNYYVRNKDLNFTIVARKKDMVSKDKNYMWLDARGKKAVYVRNSYKTSSTYGSKSHTITDEQFFTALKNVFNCQKRDDICGVIIGNEGEDNLGYWVSKATYNNLGEGNYVKIIINAYKNDLQKLKEISTSRGTNLETIISNYDVERTE